jgi:hypothetical protein
MLLPVCAGLRAAEMQQRSSAAWELTSETKLRWGAAMHWVPTQCSRCQRGRSQVVRQPSLCELLLQVDGSRLVPPSCHDICTDTGATAANTTVCDHGMRAHGFSMLLSKTAKPAAVCWSVQYVRYTCKRLIMHAPCKQPSSHCEVSCGMSIGHLDMLSLLCCSTTTCLHSPTLPCYSS